MKPNQFPKTFQDLGFIERNNFKAQDYNAYANLSPYEELTLVALNEELADEIIADENDIEQNQPVIQNSFTPSSPETQAISTSSNTQNGAYCRAKQPGIPANQKIPFGSPVLHSDYVFCSPYGVRYFKETKKHDNHYGFDIGCTEASFDTPVFAPADGVVSKVIPNRTGKSAGNYIVIDHGNGFSTYYMHLNQVLVTKGQHVLAGCQIATIGNTGGAKAFMNGTEVAPTFQKKMSHLHYEMHYKGNQTYVTNQSGTKVSIQHGFSSNASINPTPFLCVYDHFKYGCK